MWGRSVIAEPYRSLGLRVYAVLDYAQPRYMDSLAHVYLALVCYRMLRLISALAGEDAQERREVMPWR
jgi:hypothetical protein